MISTDAFFDELEKIAGRLNKQERKEQSAKFTGLGAVALPAVTAATNLITHGRPVPKGISAGRWLAGQSLGGAAMGGALPAAQHQIERNMQEKARERRAASKGN